MKEKSFTLVELLVTISIIAILTAVALPGLKRGEELFALQRATNKLAQDIRRASEMAMGGKVFGAEFPRGGYGIYFLGINRNDYILFADLNNNSSYDGEPERVEDLNLEERGVIIHSISPGTPLSIVFFPPDPRVTIRSGNATFTEATITLSQRDDTLKVKVNRAGLIEVTR